MSSIAGLYAFDMATLARETFGGVLPENSAGLRSGDGHARRAGAEGVRDGILQNHTGAKSKLSSGAVR